MVRFRWLGVVLLLALCAPAAAAIDCDGVDDYVLSPGTLADYKAASAGTWMAWFTPTGADPAGPVSCTSAVIQLIMGSAPGSSTQRITLGRRTSTSLCAMHFDGTQRNAFADDYGGVNTTVHLAAVHTGGNLDLYLNGVFMHTASSGDTSFSAGHPVYVCNNNSVNHAVFEGRVHQATISDVAYSASEIAVLALSRRPRLRKSVATGDWLFDNCADGASGDTVAFRDHSGNSKTMTASGTTCRGGRIFSFGGGIQ